MSRVLWIALVLLTACAVDPAPMEAAHIQRVEGINRRYDAQIAANDARWDALKKQVEGRRQYRIPVVEGTVSRPMHAVMDSFEAPLATCTQTEDVTSCQKDVWASYVRALKARYYLANFPWIRDQLDKNADLDIEWLATKSHNAHLEQQIRNELAEIEKAKRDFRGTLNGYRRDEVTSSRQERDHEIENAEDENRAVWAAALQGLGQGMQAASANRSQSQPQAYSAPGCTSDFSCGMGHRCVKNYGQGTGVCMKAVDEHGVPSFESPSTDSVLPNLPNGKDCTARGCPAGFRCDYGSGVCIR